MVRGMTPGSVIIDMAAERGGNCELTRMHETIAEHGVTISGPVNLASSIPYHASQMYARNLTALVLHLTKAGLPEPNLEDEITREALAARGGEIVHPRVREAMELEPRPAPSAAGR